LTGLTAQTCKPTTVTTFEFKYCQNDQCTEVCDFTFFTAEPHPLQTARKAQAKIAQAEISHVKQSKLAENVVFMWEPITRSETLVEKLRFQGVPLKYQYYASGPEL